MGNVAVHTEQKASYDGQGNKTYQNETEYYTPFIAQNVIHTNRVGGLNYYKIPGLFEQANGAQQGSSETFNIPMIRKTKSSGTDTT